MPYTLKPADAYDIDIEDVSYLNDRVDTGDRWVLNFGPQHPATHTTLRLVLELDGERVARVTPHIGYLHSGFEKLGEVLDYNQYVTIVSRMDYLSPISCDICWHHCVEKLFGIDLTPRCKVVRTIMAELGRIQNHLMCVGAAALDLGAFTGFLYAFNPRERIYDICDLISGQRFHPDWTRVGGAMQDLPDEGLFKRMVAVSCVETSTSLGWTAECRGMSNTSSKVSPSMGEIRGSDGAVTVGTSFSPRYHRARSGGKGRLLCR